jgi:hypothetical protein
VRERDVRSLASGITVSICARISGNSFFGPCGRGGLLVEDEVLIEGEPAGIASGSGMLMRYVSGAISWIDAATEDVMSCSSFG